MGNCRGRERDSHSPPDPTSGTWPHRINSAGHRRIRDRVYGSSQGQVRTTSSHPPPAGRVSFLGRRGNKMCVSPVARPYPLQLRSLKPCESRFLSAPPSGEAIDRALLQHLVLVIMRAELIVLVCQCPHHSVLVRQIRTTPHGQEMEKQPSGIDTSTGGGDTALRERSEKVESEAKAKRESISSLL